MTLLTKDSSLIKWLTYLENRHSDVIQLGLERVLQVAKLLNLHQTKAKVITVAGTNGKGSTVATLESLYSVAGYRVGTYTSPHLVHFNERIRINQESISDKALCEALSVLESTPGGVKLTYFEITTLAALWYFSQQSFKGLKRPAISLSARAEKTACMRLVLCVLRVCASRRTD